MRRRATGLVAMFGNEALADSALDTWARFVKNPERVTADVRQIAGVPPHSFSESAAAHAKDFRND